MLPFLDGVEDKKPYSWKINRVLNEPVFVLPDIGKRRAEFLSFVVVPDRQIIWHPEFFQALVHRFVGCRLTGVRQVARYDAEIGVALSRVYVGYTGFKPGSGVQAI